MADLADQAQEDTERVEEALLSQRVAVAPVGSESASDCAECGLEIPSARQVLIPGTQHCTECAALLFERRW